MGARLPQICLGRGERALRGIHGSLRGLKRGYLLVPRLRAHNALLCQRHGAAGVGLLVFSCALCLRQAKPPQPEPAPRR